MYTSCSSSSIFNPNLQKYINLNYLFRVFIKFTKGANVNLMANYTEFWFTYLSSC
jgi:hypothetical protein